MSDFTDDHDPYTFRYLSSLGLERGWICADVGAGGGSVARWLISQVAPEGRVVAVDVEASLLRHALVDTPVEVSGQDIAKDPLPTGQFDLVHTRMMLCNLPSRTQILLSLCNAVRSGGWLVLGDLDFTVHAPITASRNWDDVWAAYLDCLYYAGWDPAYGRRLATSLENCGLADVTAETVTRRVRGGSLPCRLSVRALENASTLLRDVRRDQIRAVQEELEDRGRAFIAPAFTIASGRRP